MCFPDVGINRQLRRRHGADRAPAEVAGPRSLDRQHGVLPVVQRVLQPLPLPVAERAPERHLDRLAGRVLDRERALLRLTAVLAGDDVGREDGLHHADAVDHGLLGLVLDHVDGPESRVKVRLEELVARREANGGIDDGL
jgi:hypothetical protein